MSPRFLARAALLLAVCFGVLLGPARARAAGTASAGAVVVAVGDEAATAAEALARVVYRDPALRPPIDDATARALAGMTPATSPNAALKDLVELRRSVATADSDAAARRLLAAIGAEAHAHLVVAVRAGPDKPTAKILRVETASYAGAELTAAAPTEPNAPPTFPDAAATLRGLLPPAAPVASAPGPARAADHPAASQPAKKSDSGEHKPAWSSPWFWAGLGALVTVGVTVFVVGHAVEQSNDTVHLQGSVSR